MSCLRSVYLVWIISLASPCYLFAYWVFLHVFFVVCWFFQNQLFRKILLGIPSECQTVWIQIRPYFSLCLIWVQAVCKSYPQTTLVDIVKITRVLWKGVSHLPSVKVAGAWQAGQGHSVRLKTLWRTTTMHGWTLTAITATQQSVDVPN